MSPKNRTAKNRTTGDEPARGATDRPARGQVAKGQVAKGQVAKGGVARDGYPFDSVSEYPVGEIVEAWERERPGTPVDSIGVVTPLWRLAKLFADDRRRLLNEAGVDPATLDLLSVLRRAGKPYRLSTRELARRSLVTAGAISQRIARAERAGHVTRETSADGSRTVLVSLTSSGHDLVEATVDRVLTRESELLSSLSDRQRKTLANQLQRLLTDVRRRTAP